MKQKAVADFCRRNFFLFGMLLLSACYLFFPCNNPSCDAINYAADVKYATDLFWPHHLIHNAFHFCVYEFCGIFCSSIDAMALMNVVTALFAIATLLVSWRILTRLTEESTAKALVLLLGACFGFMRYSVQCETYIIPIFFSVTASYFFLWAVRDNKLLFAFASGIMSVLACLFHQVQIFWTIGLLIGLLFSRHYRETIAYAITLLVIPIVYSLTLVYYDGGEWSVPNLFHYALSYYFTENSASGIGWKNLLMTPVSFVRCIVQVHGNFVILLKMMPWLYAMFLLLPVMAYMLFRMIRHGHKAVNDKLFGYVHWGIFVFQFAFACFSDGNTEFMVMLPFALTFGLASLFYMPARSLLILATSLFVWNFCWAILPENIYCYYNEEAVVDYLNSNQDAKFIAADEHTVENLYYYHYGDLAEDRIFELGDEIPDGEYVTDIPERPSPLNRNRMLNDLSSDCFDDAKPIEEIDADFGNYHLYKVKYSAK